MKNYTEKALWNKFSLFIRLRDSDWRGYGKCISCSIVKHYKQMQAGHFIPAGSDKALKYNELNVNIQCVSCNYFKHGNQLEYRRGLVEKIGEKKVKELEISHYFKITHKKLNQMEINALYKFYDDKIKRIKLLTPYKICQK